MIIIIVAFDENNVIGNNGKIPWNLPGDMKLFKQRTIGNSVIMGRKTWESLPKKPLPDRYNIVITSQVGNYEDLSSVNLSFVDSIHKSIRKANKKLPDKDIFVIGGGEIYSAFLKSGVVDKIIVTRVSGKHTGDSYFPNIGDEWKIISDNKHEDGFAVQEYDRLH